MAIFPGAISTNADLYIAVNNLSTLLTDNPLTIGATTVNVVSTTGFPTVGFISIDAEIIKYTGITATSFTGCTRGADGTTATSHLLNAQVDHNVIAAHHNVAKDEIIAIETHFGINGANIVHIAGTETITGQKTFSAPVLHPDGTAALPGVAFSADPDNGLYRITTNSIGFSTAGTHRLALTATGRFAYNILTERTDIVASNPLMQLEGTSFNTSSFSFLRNSNDGGSSALVLGKTRGTVTGSTTIVNSGDSIGTVYFVGADGTKIVEGARIRGVVDGTPGVDDMPMRIEFLTAPDGTATPVIRVSITNTGETQFSDGTASVPGLSFLSDTDTGLYRPGNNNIGFCTSATEHWRITSAGNIEQISSTGKIQAQDGTAALPLYTFVSDTNTGVYRRSADQIAFSAGGVDAGVFGNVSTIPGFFATDGTVGRPGIAFLSDGDTGIYRSGTNTVDISAGGTLVATFATTGVSIRGTTTNDNAAAGNVGEYVESVISTVTNFPATTTFGDLTSISLTAGDWDVCINGVATLNAATMTDWTTGISTTSGNSSAGLVIGSNRAIMRIPTTNEGSFTSITAYRISLSATTTIYYKYSAGFSAGTPQLRGRLSARRVR